MKINFGKAAQLLGRIAVAAPLIIATVKPLIRSLKADRIDKGEGRSVASRLDSQLSARRTPADR